MQFESAFANANLNYRSQFFFWNELFTLPNFPVYADLVNPPLVRSLPIVAVVIAVVMAIKIAATQGEVHLRGLLRGLLREPNRTFYFFLRSRSSLPFLSLIGRKSFGI